MHPGGAQLRRFWQGDRRLNEEYRGILSAERQANRMQIGTRDERRYAEQRERDMLLFGQRKELQGERIAAQEGRPAAKPPPQTSHCALMMHKRPSLPRSETWTRLRMRLQRPDQASAQ